MDLWANAVLQETNAMARESNASHTLHKPWWFITASKLPTDKRENKQENK